MGFIRSYSSQDESVQGTSHYMAPEMILDGKYSWVLRSESGAFGVWTCAGLKISTPPRLVTLFASGLLCLFTLQS